MWPASMRVMIPLKQIILWYGFLLNFCYHKMNAHSEKSYKGSTYYVSSVKFVLVNVLVIITFQIVVSSTIFY